MLLGHPIDLKAKAGGEKSMSEKRESLEDAEGVVPQDPRDKAKAILLQTQSPVGISLNLSLLRLRTTPKRAVNIF